MAKARIAARLDIKGPNLIKGIHLEGLRVIGNPAAYAKKYYSQGADELIYMDSVASLYGRNNLTDIVKDTCHDVFIPITVGGGIRSTQDAYNLLRSGADKIAINTAAVKNPDLLTDLASKFGSQCVVVSIEAKKESDSWEAFTDNGRERTGLDVVEWAILAETKGAGEILLTSIDQEGTCKGLDINLIRAVSERVSIPVIASGGLGDTKDYSAGIQAGAKAVACAHALHYDKLNINSIKIQAENDGISVRKV